ncbi:MAG: VOC family protein [Gemmatimonadetes bacterium]|nr:VOC family protein [Gemmatimonadota bacterium]NIQ58745.1 VOC family protein [Gemmatimonadota bacterium]NIU78928.1 VOC family protein [Gammaproteobacteria bacterium]NIX47691.1 VOC family protein [Gemmatimonadota bacterium]NIY12065.1 VOC family protein [Gemmatimonadota bacterium]
MHDVGAATAYYRDRLGMRLLFEAGGMAFFDCGGIRLMLGPPSSEEHDHPGSIVYFEVADIEAAHWELEARGVEFMRAPGRVAEVDGTELWLAFFRDPWENVLALMSEVPAG